MAELILHAEYIDFELKYESVTEEEYYNFLELYPRDLDRNVSSVCDPPVISYNDFELGKFPDSIVASRCAYSDDKNDYYYVPPEERWWRILKNYEEFYNAVQAAKNNP